MQLIFKEVGQGDSILVQWKEGDRDRIVIIDCNIKEDGSNPVLKHLQDLNLDRIELIVSTHPHTDHFSGILQILDYAEENRIKIGAFLHTSQYKKQFFNSAVKGNVASDALSKLFKKVLAIQKGDPRMPIAGINAVSREFDLEGAWKLKFLAPYDQDYLDFSSNSFKHLDKGTINRGDANLLSTVIKLYEGNRYILLTGDCTQHVFSKIFLREFEKDATKGTLELLQVAHHGSGDNYYEPLISQLNGERNVPAVISVGQNSYGHPSEDMKIELQKLGYTIYETNFPANSASASKMVTKSRLGMISTPAGSSGTRTVCQDQVFTF
jgi:beta-lactamase superfamily II metal-dependent hydrolase